MPTLVSITKKKKKKSRVIFLQCEKKNDSEIKNCQLIKLINAALMATKKNNVVRLPSVVRFCKILSDALWTQ